MVNLNRFYNNVKSAEYKKETIGDKTRYTSVKVIDNSNNVSWIPASQGNVDYKELLRLVDAGELTIEGAD